MWNGVKRVRTRASRLPYTYCENLHLLLHHMLRSTTRLNVSARRSVSYILPAVPLLENIRASGADFTGLYSNKSVADLWFTRGQSIVNQLNSQLEENKVRNPPADLGELITLTFNKPELHGVYAQASLLHNLHFCLESLKPSTGTVQRASPAAVLQTPSTATRFANEPRDDALAEWIRDLFGSVAELRTLLLNSAHAVKGDGVTWLVAQATYSESALRAGAGSDVSFNKLAVMNTYNAGIVDDAIRLGQVAKLKQQKAVKADALKRKREETGTVDAAAAADADAQALGLVLGTVEEAEEALLYSDRKLVPLLAIDASMRAYLHDYGVFGKPQYLDNVWECIDWDIVAKRAPRRFKPSVVFEN